MNSTMYLKEKVNEYIYAKHDLGIGHPPIFSKRGSPNTEAVTLAM